MDYVSPALQAVGLFLVTNIDDIIVLSLFFARRAGQRGTTTKIVVGQYLGFGAILLASIAVTLGAGLFLPDGAIPYFGLIPLLLGGYAAWQVWRNRDDDDDAIADKPLSASRWPLSPSPTAETTSGSTCRCSWQSELALWSPTASCFWLLSLSWSWPPSTWLPANRSLRCWNAGTHLVPTRAHRAWRCHLDRGRRVRPVNATRGAVPVARP